MNTEIAVVSGLKKSEFDDEVNREIYDIEYNLNGKIKDIKFAVDPSYDEESHSILYAMIVYEVSHGE